MAILLLFLSLSAWANPYPIPSLVPQDADYGKLEKLPTLRAPQNKLGQIEIGEAVLRLGVSVDLGSGKYQLQSIRKENSGTPAGKQRSLQKPKFGSYHARILDGQTKQILAYDSIGTGKEYRKLVNEITFRFPFFSQKLLFQLEAENPQTGEMELVLSTAFDPQHATSSQLDISELEIRELNRPTAAGTELRMNIYAEGYLSNRRETFWGDAEKTVQAFVNSKFPGLERMHFYAVFLPSQETLGNAHDYGNQIIEKNTNLGLYFPYWDNFGRWYDVIYPTREERFRSALAVAPYDYTTVLVDDGVYWGVGNFRYTTAVPARHSSFIFLLLHEAGHYFGLNEEYDIGGRTELEFAPDIQEPWSQNMTFLSDPNQLKWKSFVAAGTPIPTPSSFWSSAPQRFGAYRGGYGQSTSTHPNHKPGRDCVMEKGKNFCPICREGILQVMRFDLGKL